MQVDLIKIGNSRGIRIPAAILRQCGIESAIELEVRGREIVLRPISQSREGWAAAFQRMHDSGDDELLIAEEIDNELLEEWDED